MSDMLRVRGVPAPRRVFLAIPTNRGVSPETTQSLFASAVLLDRLGYGVDLAIERGNCHVDDARNALVREFFESDCGELVFIDDDVGFDSTNLARLLSHDVDVVAGIYPKKEDRESFPVFVESGTELWADERGLVEVHGVPTGFLKIRRRVLERLREKAVAYQGNDGKTYHVIFERLVADGRRWSGDYGFCRKWLAEGGQIFADPALSFTHTGGKTWAGNLGDYWKRVHGVKAQEDEATIARVLASIRRGSVSDEALLELCVAWGNEWMATSELLRATLDKCSGRVLECGSGLTTLVLAAAGCRVTALEHDPAYASHTLAMLERHGLSADVLCRPLRDGWYDFDGGDFDCILVDGPPRAKGDRMKVLERCWAPVVIWDDYAGGLENVQVMGTIRPFAVQEA
jgi:hypothetical protein